MSLDKFLKVYIRINGINIVKIPTVANTGIKIFNAPSLHDSNSISLFRTIDKTNEDVMITAYIIYKGFKYF